MQHQSRISFIYFFLPIVLSAIGFVLLGCLPMVMKTDGYIKGGFHKAIAANDQGYSGQSWDEPSVEEAIKSALEVCEKTWKGPCEIIEVDEMPYAHYLERKKHPMVKKIDEYKKGGFHKAIASDSIGNSGQSWDEPSVEEAIKSALEVCEKTWKSPCEIIEVDEMPYAEYLARKESSAEDNSSKYDDIDKQTVIVFPKIDKSHSYKNMIANKATTEYFQGVRWAVVIGISKYSDSQIPSLRYASNDANSFYKWLISPNGGGYTPSRVKLLISEDAIGKNIKDALFNWLEQALEEDIVTIYFAGHGTPQSPDKVHNLFLLPYDTQYNNIAATGFPMWDIETALKRFIKAKKIVVIADACHAGGIGQSFDIARRDSRGIYVNPINSGIQNLSQIGDGVCVISASDHKQLSQESKKWGGGHGVFTHFLLEGLQGSADYNRDTIVTLGELIPYLSEQVRRSTNNAQSPTVAGKFDPALSIGR